MLHVPRVFSPRKMLVVCPLCHAVNVREFIFGVAVGLALGAAAVVVAVTAWNLALDFFVTAV